ncbi:MAG: beta-ketoacyl synthase [Alteromonadaceae bacterium]|nr:MAG: beta-ketoacyl synthase [Alteromonadaceae bacterium]
MKSRLPLIVGFGGFNAAGRSSAHMGYRRMILDSLPGAQRKQTIGALAAMMGLSDGDEQSVLQGTLVRKIESALFDVDHAPVSKKIDLQYQAHAPISFTATAKQLPRPLPEHWKVASLDEEGKLFRVTLLGDQGVSVKTGAPLAVKAAGQLPSGFDPSIYYRSQHHPRGLQMAVMGASDALKSVGISWDDIHQIVSPDEVAVYSSSVMSQLDHTGLGGLMSSRERGERVSSKQLTLGLNTMPADFVNAYVLGSLGATGSMSGACATFLYNLRLGVEEIRSGRRKVVIVGASEAPILPEIIDGYAAMSALATDADLNKLDGTKKPDYRRASRPFGANCGFTIAESVQYTVLMADDLAVELGAKVYGAVPGVYVNADGYKKSISAPGAGNYITMARALGLAKTLVGADVVRNSSFVQAHGSSTPQNRVTESKIFDEVAKAFGISDWPVVAVKSYLGHSLGPASGDQLAATLGAFEYGILPGIKTLDAVADDVFDERLNISVADLNLGRERCQVGFLNSKGFGGNNATATVLSPMIVENYLQNHYTKTQLTSYRDKLSKTQQCIDTYASEADRAEFKPIYEFGSRLIDEREIVITEDSIRIPGFENGINLVADEGLSGF